MTSDGMLASIMGDHSAARSRLEASATIHRQHGKSRDLAHALCFMAYELVTNDPVRARSLAEEGLAIGRATGDKFFVTMALTHLGAVAFVQRDFDAARRCYEEAVAVGRELNDKWALASSLRGLGNVVFLQGDFGAAESHLKESLISLGETREKWLISRAFETLAEMYSAKGNYQRAARLFGAAASARDAVGASVLTFYRDNHEHRIVAARDDLGNEQFESLWAEGRGMTLDEAVDYAVNLPSD
jgi:tetratricopeptide (TPR) repeat protein